MQDWRTKLDEVAHRTAFSGAVRVDGFDDCPVTATYGWANRSCELPVRATTRFGIASASKGFTALVVMRLVQDELMSLQTAARTILGSDLPLIDDRVTVEHLLAHRSGIGDYLDEDLDLDINDYLMPIDVRRLDCTEAYLAILDGFAQKRAPGADFAYCNSGFVVLALLAERVAGTSFAELITRFVGRPAGMTDTGMIRSDELPADTAVGYLHPGGLRSNVFHLPVLGSGDGGAYSTVADFARFWRALFEGRLLETRWVDQMVEPISATSQDRRYGLGFWLRGHGSAVYLEGCDAGVSFRSVHDPTRGVTHTVVSNTSDGAWPMSRALAESLAV